MVLQEFCVDRANSRRKRSPTNCYCKSDWITGVPALLAVLHGLLIQSEWLTRNKYFFSSDSSNELARLALASIEAGAKTFEFIGLKVISFVAARRQSDKHFLRKEFKGQKWIACFHGTEEKNLPAILETGMGLCSPFILICKIHCLIQRSLPEIFNRFPDANQSTK